MEVGETTTRTPIESPACWSGAQVRARQWWRDLARAEIDALLAGARRVEREIGAELDALVGHPLPEDTAATLAPLATEVRDTLEHGSGFVVLRGIPVEEWSRAEIAIAYWLLGSRLGTPLSNNAHGDMIGHVRDRGVDYQSAVGRGYDSNASLTWHNDQCDVVGLLCLAPARRGGESKLASGIAVYNAILGRDPGALETLCEPFCFSRMGEIGAGQQPWYEAPIFELRGAGLHLAAGMNHIVKGHGLPGAPPLGERRAEALRLFEATCEELAFAMDFRPGDVQLLNNGLVLHTRTAYEDWPDAARKRHLLRLWLRVPGLHEGAIWHAIWHDGVVPTAGRRRRVQLDPD